MANRGTAGLLTSQQSFNFVRPLFEAADRESLWVVALDTRNVPTAVHRVAEGSLTQTIVHPREVFKVLLLANAAGFLVAHNHPSSGDPQPSGDDDAMTRRLATCSRLMSVPFLDHIIVGGDTYFSYNDARRLRGGRQLSLGIGER